jgi:hypothetical protein
MKLRELEVGKRYLICDKYEQEGNDLILSTLSS